MQYTVLLALVAASAVSATDYYVKKYNKPDLPKYAHYDCDATKTECYAPKSYGKDYNAEGYSYEKHYEYPGPKERFCNKLKKIGGFIVGVIKKIVHGFKHTWVKFVKKWNHWCAVKRSDKARFDDWKACEAKKWKSWWGYYHDLCKTRKALWDDAQREFHRQWCHYRATRKAEYEESKKKCGIKEKDYDQEPKYQKNVNRYGVTPVEDHYHNYSSGGHYKPAEYQKHCQERDDKYKKANGGHLGNQPGQVPVPVGGDAGTPSPIPAPVGGDAGAPTGPPTPVSG